MVYISRFDVYGKGQTIYHVSRTLDETGDRVDNGQQEIYVNAAIDDGSDVAELMRVFTEDDAYSDKFPITTKRKRQFKIPEEERKMNEELRKLIEDERLDSKVSLLKDLVKDGILTIAAAAQRIGVSEESFRRLAML